MLKLRLLNDNDMQMMGKWLNKKHVKQWYEVPSEGMFIDDWMHELQSRDGEFKFLVHFIVMMDETPIGFCQYYKCVDVEECYWGDIELSGTYSIDYFIGEEDYLGKGIGKSMITLLVERIFSLTDACRIVINLDKPNKASAGVALANGFKLFNIKHNSYVLEKPKETKEVIIKRYEENYEDSLYNLIKREGDEWAPAWKGYGWTMYKKAISDCISYILFEDGELCGYMRCRDDYGFGVYVQDLLVDKEYRGKGYGRMLMEQVYLEFPKDTVYVMSGVDPYYYKLGYEVEGTIFKVKP